MARGKNKVPVEPNAVDEMRKELLEEVPKKQKKTVKVPEYEIKEAPKKEVIYVPSVGPGGIGMVPVEVD